MGNVGSGCDSTCQSNIAREVAAALRKEPSSSCDSVCQNNIAETMKKSGVINCDADCQQKIARSVWTDETIFVKISPESSQKVPISAAKAMSTVAGPNPYVAVVADA